MRDISDFQAGSAEDLALFFKQHGCRKCRWGFQKEPHGPIVYRGNLQAPVFWIGEALGREEVKKSRPFSGPAGDLLDKMIAGMGLNYLITNVLMCRPIAPQGSGKQNLTPTGEDLQTCRSYIKALLKHHKPKVAILLGKSAYTSLLPKQSSKSMGEVLYKFYLSEEFHGTLFTIMYHPAFLLRKKSGDSWPELRQATWNHLLKIKGVLEELS